MGLEGGGSPAVPTHRRATALFTIGGFRSSLYGLQLDFKRLLKAQRSPSVCPGLLCKLDVAHKAGEGRIHGNRSLRSQVAGLTL